VFFKMYNLTYTSMTPPFLKGLIITDQYITNTLPLSSKIIETDPNKTI